MIQTYRNGNKKTHQTAYSANNKETQFRLFNNCKAALKRHDWCHNSIIKTIMNNVIMPMSEDFKIHADINSFEKLKKNNFMGLFYGWGSTASRLVSLQGDMLLFATKFPDIPVTHFIDLGRMKG